MNKDFIEISDPTIDVEQILTSIEKSLASACIDLEALSKFQNQRFTPLSPEGFRSFDPLGAAHSFEKGINPPKFTSPKLWFIRGPIKWIFVSLVNLYSFVDKKLSENRIKAFFSVLHELIRINRKLKSIEIQMDLISKQIYTESGKQEFYKQSTDSQFFDLGSSFQGLEELLGKLNPALHHIILLPETGDFQILLEREKISVESHSHNPNTIDRLLKTRALQIKKTDPGSLSPKIPEKSEIIIEKPLTDLTPNQIRFLFSELSKKSPAQTKILFSISKLDSHSAFSLQSLSVCNENKLTSFMAEVGFDFEQVLLETGKFKFFQFSKKEA